MSPQSEQGSGNDNPAGEQELFVETERDKIAVLKEHLAGTLDKKQLENALLKGIVAMKQIKVWILDPAPAPPASVNVRLPQSLVLQKQNMVKDVFASISDAEVTELMFPVGSPVSVMRKHFEEDLKQIGNDEILLVYFCGNAGNNGEKYTWTMNHHPRGKVNAYNVIQACVDSGKDVVFILDCYVPDRFWDKWKLPTVGDPGNIEIIARGERLNRTDGTVNKDDSGDFSICLFTDLLDFVQNIENPPKEHGYLGWHAPCSLPRLLAKNKVMSANPRRLWLSRTKDGDNHIVTRFMLLPDHIRATGKISFFVKQIQGPMPKGIVKELTLLDSLEAEEGFDFGE